MPDEKGNTYCTWKEFREWAENKCDWIMIIYDPNSPLFMTPAGQLVSVTVDDVEHVTFAMPIDAK